MVTKESLVKDREEANVALLKLKQKYRSYANDVCLVVEGKDDIAYYTCILVRYPQFSKAEIIPASNRKKVVDTYKSVDWNVYSRQRVLFFVDRDLSDITGEETPVATNVYVTDDYSIENSLFTEDLFFVILRIFFGIEELSPDEVERLSKIYSDAKNEFGRIFMPIMSWVLHWRTNGISCNLNNLNSGDFYRVSAGVLEIKDEFKDPGNLAIEIHTQCGVPYSEYDLSDYKKSICDHVGIQRNIRGKYVRSFFVKLLKSVALSIETIFPERKKAKAIVEIGPGNALQLLCGYMKTPESLHSFLMQIEV